MITKILLFPYYLVLKIRHLLYDKGINKVYRSRVPTICIGNIAAGGTGKTPHTEMVLRTLLSEPEWRKRNLAVLSRGHRRRSRGFRYVRTDDSAKMIGDEPLQIKTKFPDITVAVDRSRVEGCNLLSNPEKSETYGKEGAEQKAAELIVLDDAFQYRSLKADFNIVLVDYNRPIRNDNLLPFGRLRDLPERLDYAEVLIITKCPNYVNNWERQKWIKSLGIADFDTKTCKGINKRGREVTVLFTTIGYCPLEPVFEEADSRYIYAKQLILFSGIAKDTPLKRSLSDNYNIVKHFKFRDHHKYKRWDIVKIHRASKRYPTAIITTTEKDCQRLRDYKNMPQDLRERLFYVPIEVHFLTDKEREIFKSTLFGAIDSISRKSDSEP